MNRSRPVFAILVAAGLMLAGSSAPPRADASPAVEEPLTVTLTLTSSGDSVQDYATAAATPGHPDYRRTLTPAQLRTRFGASAQRVARVSAAARRAGFLIGGLDATRSRLTLLAPVRTVQAALGVTVYRAIRRGVAVRAATPPTRAPWAAGDVQAVSDVTQYVARPLHSAPGLPATCSPWEGVMPGAGRRGIRSTPARRSPHASDPAGGVCAGRRIGPDAASGDQACARYWGQANNTTAPQKYPPGRQGNLLCGHTGGQLRALYGLGAADTGAGQTMVIVGAYHDPNVLSDANSTFAATGTPALPADRFTVKTYAAGGTADCDTDAWRVEEALDVQTVHTLAPAARIVYVAAPDCTRLEETLAAVVADERLGATVVSNSWGIIGEPDDPGYLAATNAMLSRAVILGIGTYFASGDFGDNSAVPDASRGPSVVFPASSPWTTAVGGTSTAIGANDQVVWQTGWANAANTLTSGVWRRLDPPFAGGAGGGTSALFAKPSWQQNVPGTRRAVPDLAALADPFTGFAVGVTIDGQFRIAPLGGTSLATPIVASLVALAQARAGSGTVIGFLAPVLYAHQAGGRGTTADVRPASAGIWAPVVSADSPPGDYLLDVDAGVQSLTTTVGYDRLTGLGTPGPTFLNAIGS